jgi:hypothetical protein
VGVMKRALSQGIRDRPIAGHGGMYRMALDGNRGWHWAGTGPCPYFFFDGCEQSPCWRGGEREAGSLRSPEPGEATRMRDDHRPMVSMVSAPSEASPVGFSSHQPASEQGPEAHQAGGAARRQLTLWE